MTNKEQILATHVQALKEYQQAILAHNEAEEAMRRATEALAKAKTGWDNACAAFNEVHAVKSGSGRRLEFTHSRETVAA